MNTQKVYVCLVNSFQEFFCLQTIFGRFMHTQTNTDAHVQCVSENSTSNCFVLLNSIKTNIYIKSSHGGEHFFFGSHNG